MWLVFILVFRKIKKTGASNTNADASSEETQLIGDANK